MKKNDLRQQAEAKLSKRKEAPAKETDALRLIHELEVHQIELEMQNEELVQSRAEAEAVHRQYADLYDFAPLGYFTLTRDGTIRLSNLTGANLLGAERNKLVKRRFAVFVSVESRPVFNGFLEKIFTTGNNEACEIMLLKEGHDSCWVHLDAVCSEDRLECRVVMKDITTRKQVDDSLRESEERFKAIANYAVSWESWFGPDGKYIWVNPAVEHFTGYSAQEILAMPDFISTVIAEEDRSTFIKRFQEAIRGNREENFEFRYLHKNGAKRWLSASWQPIYDAQGHPLGTRSSGYDITERKQAEETLAYQASLLAQVSDAVIVTDGDLIIQSLNKAAERMFGYTADEAIGKSARGRLDPEYIGTTREAAFQQMNETGQWQNEVLLHHKDGSPIYAIVAGSVLRNQAGGISGYLSVHHNITERKQAEEALQKSTQLLEKTMSSLLDAVFIIDADTVEIMDCNPAASTIFGYSRQEMLGQTTAFLHVSEASLEEFRQQLNSDMEAGKDFMFLPEYRMKRKDGTVFFSEHSVVPLKNKQGQRIGWVSVVRDITENKLAVEALRESEAHFRNIIDLSPVPYALNDEQQNITYLNTAFTTTFGYNLKDIPTLADWWPKAYPDLEYRRWVAETWQVHLEKAKAEGAEFEPMELNIQCKDGSVKTALVSAGALIESFKGIHLVILYDITERKQAEKELEEQKQKLSYIIQGTNAGTWEWNVQTSETIFNERWAEIIGYTLEEISPVSIDTWTKFTHADDLQRSNELLEKNFSGELEYYECEARMRHKNGNWVWVLDRGKVVTWTEDGKPLFMFGTHQDVTERKQAEEALRVSEEHYRLLANNVPDVIYSLDGAGNIVTVNSPAFERYGYTEQDAKGKPFLGFIHPEDREIVVRSFLKALEEQRKFTHGLQFRIVAENGLIYWFELNSQARFDSQGGYMGEDGVLRDITRRKQADEALRASEAQYRLLAEHMEDVIWLMDVKANKFVYVSPSVYRLRGYTSQEVMSQPVSASLTPESAELVQQTLTQAFQFVQEGKEIPTLPVQIEQTRKDGTTVWTEAVSNFIFDENGIPTQVIGLSRDITERKQAEKERAESHALLTNLARLVPGVIYQYRIYPDGHSAFPYSSPGMNDIYEVTPEEVREDATSVFGRLHPDDYDDVANLIQESARTLQEFFCEFRVILPRQGLRWRWSQAHPERTADGGTLWHGIISDITERKLVEEALQASEKKYRELFEINKDGIAILLVNPYGPPGTFVEMNDAAVKMLGYTREEMLELTPTILEPQATSEQLKLRQVEFASRGIVNFETVILHKNGQAIFTEFTSQLIQYENRPAVMNIMRDITERKQIEDTLLFLLQSGYQDEDFFHSLARHLTSSLSMDYVCIDRLAGDQLSAQTLAIYFDGKFDDNVSYTLKDTPCGDVVGKSVCVFPSQVRHLFPLDVVLQEMPAESYAGTTLWSSQGQPIGLIAVIGREPLSLASQRMAESILKLVAVRAAGELERQQADEEIRQLNANLEQRVEERTRELGDAQEQLVRHEKLAVLGQMASSVGHELRNPLGVINSAVYYLKMVQPDVDEKIKEYHNMIEQEVWNSEKIITDLLDFARIKSVDREPVTVSELIRQTLERFPAPPSITVTLDIPADLPRIFVDPRQMTQVLGNLIVNACQAMKDGGKLTILSRVEETVDEGSLAVYGEPSSVLRPQSVLISVQDTGIGIPPENMSKLFEPLFTTKSKGIGLGLAVSQKLTEANGGKIEVQSEPGVGSTFTVWLPVK